ncbi:MAG: beta-ketoacyl-ACP synthase II [Planctomycetes bacterium]|nr:beta-ketoacyl-ACP synthase II [Planctomycetota bacterium]
MASGRRVVITGVGAVTAFGEDKEALWKALCEGRSGISNITAFDTTEFDVKFAGEVKDFDPEKWLDRKGARHLDRFAQLAVAASELAIEDSGLDLEKVDKLRVGVVVGSGIGGLTEIEAQHSMLMERGPSRVSPFMIPKLMVNAAAGQISIRYGFCGPNSAVATACASGANALGDAFKIVQRGDADIAISGGTEAAVTPMGVSGFSQMRAISRRNEAPQKASRPFDRNRDGFVMAEGAGILVLEELEHAKRRGAHIYAEFLGYGMSGDAWNITAPDPDGKGAARAMKAALDDAGVSPEQVVYINAHGTSTPLNDAIETRSMRYVFNSHADKLVISSTKSMLGHMLGASGGVELAICALVAERGVVPPTINYETPDPECDLDYIPNEARELRADIIMSNSFGFGGHNASLVIGRFS